PRPASSTLFPYTTLFRSRPAINRECVAADEVMGRSSVGWLHTNQGAMTMPERPRPIVGPDPARHHPTARAHCRHLGACRHVGILDRKSTRLNSSHVSISY